MELYSSLERLKQEMNGGGLPPMTAVPENVHDRIDPKFTIGLGALTEDVARGLRCPVRGCGKWYHNLACHASTKHKRIGGARGIRAALDIPSTVPLVSRAMRARMRLTQRAICDSLSPEQIARRVALLQEGRVRAGGYRSGKKNAHTVNQRNLIAMCEEQIRHKLIDLQHSLGGRSPVAREAADKFGPSFVWYLERVYGSWNAAKAQFGLERTRLGGKSKIPMEDILTTLRSYYAIHGSLPTQHTVDNRSTVPLMFVARVYRRAFGTDSWPEAMRRAAARLNIYGGRYGLPPRKEKVPA